MTKTGFPGSSTILLAVKLFPTKVLIFQMAADIENAGSKETRVVG